MCQSGRLPSKKYRALSWRLSTAVACTRVADYHPKNAVHHCGAEYHGSMYQSGRLPSAAGDGLTNIMENHTFVPRAHYLRLLRRRRRYEPQYHSVLRLCSGFRDSRSFLCLNIKKKYPRQKSMHKKNAARSGRDLIVSCLYENIPTLATQTRW